MITCIITICAVVFAVLLVSFIIYRKAFCFDRELSLEKYCILEGDQYEPLRPHMNEMVDEACALPFEDVWTTSFDGLKLHGNFYAGKKGAPVQIMFHGYHGNPTRDFSGGIPLAVSQGLNVIAIDERAHGKSEGKCLTFGILERRDVVSWAEYAAERFGKDKPIILTGISMGAATVLMASNLTLPENVKCIISDCGYTSASEIIAKVMKEMHLPPVLLMPFVRLGAKLFGHFELDEADAPSSLAETNIPVLFIHGEDDRFVPCEMSRCNYEACASEKVLLTVPDAGHGLSFIIDHEGYLKTREEFLKKVSLL